MTKEIKGYIVTKVPGHPAELHPHPQRELLLPEMQALVGGYIERGGGGEGWDLWCNEEGRLVGLAPNLAYRGGVIVGPVFAAQRITGPDGGESWPFPSRERAREVADQLDGFAL